MRGANGAPAGAERGVGAPRATAIGGPGDEVPRTGLDLPLIRWRTQPGSARAAGSGIHLTCCIDCMAETSPVRVLVADDQADILNALTLLLSDEGYDVIQARSPGEALERLEAADFDLAILDLNYTRDTTSGQEGLD